MLAGVRVHVIPVEGNIDRVRVSVPVNPSTGAMVMVEVPAAPASTVTVVGAVVTVKSLIV